MNNLKFFATTLAVVFATTATTQPQQKIVAASTTSTAEAAQLIPATGAPVACIAKGYWSGGSVTFTIKKLDGRNGTADVDFLDTTGYSLSKAWMGAKGVQWTYTAGVLEYVRPNAVKFHLTVGERTLRGSYTNYNSSRVSMPDVIFNCDGPTSRVIVR